MLKNISGLYGGYNMLLMAAGMKSYLSCSLPFIHYNCKFWFIVVLNFHKDRQTEGNIYV